MATALRSAAMTGALFGTVAVYLALVGLLALLHTRWIIVDVVTEAQALLLAVGLGAGFAAARRRSGTASLAGAMAAGLVAATMLASLAVLMQWLDLRSMFIALSPPLLRLLTFGREPAWAFAILLGLGLVLGAAAALLLHTPRVLRRPLIAGTAAVIVAGVFQELIQIMLQTHPQADVVREWFYGWDGLTRSGAALVFAIVATAAATWSAARAARPPRTAPASRLRDAAGAAVMLLSLVLFPWLAGSYIGQVMMLVALYILMGMGLNLEFGLAGLLDLGFVAFFAVGAYTTALLSADSPLALAALSFWAAMPIAVLMSVTVGVLFGIPVLGVRGDYLAVATLGLGEIVRVILVSDFASPLLGGAQGILQIPRPSIAGHELDNPVELFYLTLAAALIAAYVAWRLQRSRLGRAWMALRDDEDVAQALGVNLIRVKLLAYGLGAAFAGLAGSIFATMVTTIYPSSFQLVVSINVLALIIVGGTGSLPGVVLGAVALVGLPELLREFGEYRYLFYGAALIVMMRIRPEGLWPSGFGRRESRGERIDGQQT